MRAQWNLSSNETEGYIKDFLRSLLTALYFCNCSANIRWTFSKQRMCFHTYVPGMIFPPGWGAVEPCAACTSSGGRQGSTRSLPSPSTTDVSIVLMFIDLSIKSLYRLLSVGDVKILQSLLSHTDKISHQEQPGFKMIDMSDILDKIKKRVCCHDDGEDHIFTVISRIECCQDDWVVSYSWLSGWQ